MNTKPQTSNTLLKLLFYAAFSFITYEFQAQQVLSQLKIERGASNNQNEFMVTDQQGNFYVGLDFATDRDSIIIGDTSVSSFRVDPETIFLDLTDFYLFRFNPQHVLTGSFVIDNAEEVEDFYSSGRYSLISLSLHTQEDPDSAYPITLNGTTEISRDGNRGKGALIVLDEQMQLEKYVFLSTGKLGQVAIDDHYAYLEFRIPDGAPYILVGQDTVHNYSAWPLMEFGYQTIVLCKYDLVTDEILWWRRMGGALKDELRDILIDSKGNLIIHGWTSSGWFFFTEQDTAVNYQEDKPFFAKLSPEGDILWWILHTNQHGELFHTIKLDKEDNLYSLGEYIWDDYIIEDTILHNPRWMDGRRTDRALVVKYDTYGEFKWISQLEGDFLSATLFDIAIQQEVIIVSGFFRQGGAKFGNIEHEINIGEENVFLWGMHPETGNYRSHGYDSGENVGRIANLCSDQQDILNMYFISGGDEEIFGTFFPGDPGGGYLVKCTADLISSIPTDAPPGNDYLIYPYPILMGENIRILNSDVQYGQKVFYTIYSIWGVTTFSDVGVVLDEYQEIITSGLLPGIYVISLQIGNKSINQRLIVQ